DLKTRVESRLRAGGVRILTEAEDQALAKEARNAWDARHAVLSFQMPALTTTEGKWFVHLHMNVDQIAWVSRRGEVVRIVASTWETGRYGAFQAKHLERGDLLKIADGMVDEFITDWRAAHPDEVPTPAAAENK